jgi:hypothetical protein
MAASSLGFTNRIPNRPGTVEVPISGLTGAPGRMGTTVPPCATPAAPKGALGRVWDYVRDALWLFLTLTATATFLMPGDALDLVTIAGNATGNATGSGDSCVGNGELEDILVRAGSVTLLLATTAVPCLISIHSEIMVLLSYVLALSYWIAVLAMDSFDVIEPWFGITVLVALLLMPLCTVPFVVTRILKTGRALTSPFQ